MVNRLQPVPKVAIWKFSLPIHGRTSIQLPNGRGGYLTVGVQSRNQPVLWAEVSPECPLAPRVIEVRMTGELYAPSGGERYLGTFQLSGGYVGHVFDLGEGP